MERIFAFVMNRALICMGSNENREMNLSICRQYLSEEFPTNQYSTTCITSPYGTSYKKDFINQLILVYTHKSLEEISITLKSIEVKMGRNSLHKEKGIVVIDIDLVMWNNRVLKPEDMARDYIKSLLLNFP